ncbi:MAG TPA: NeuD/PglB/VioB family sugar acetyltransferase [Candidatus Levybacteria bacterium]|nr:NeuD/PglB/VioB family sugar acetyltransferase [Candidatus Levybacteria bacterium]
MNNQKKIDRGIVIIGGSSGALIAEEIFESQYERIFFLETYSKSVVKSRIIADTITKGLDYLKKRDVEYFIATGDNKKRQENFQLIYKHIKKYPVNCIHESAYVSKSSSIGYGNLICPKSVIHTNASIGNNTIINTASVIEHDVIVSDYAQISPNATLAGRVVVGRGAFLGVGSVVIPDIKIGEWGVIAAGAAVISSTKRNALYAGVPAVYKKDLK